MTKKAQKGQKNDQKVLYLTAENAEFFYHEGTKGTKKLDRMTGFFATESTEGTEFFARRCGLGSGFLDTSICKACGRRPPGHQGWPA